MELLRFLAPVALLALGLLVPQSTYAANPSDPDGNLYTGSLAGKPINGISYDAAGAPLQWNPSSGTYIPDKGTGHGIAYARVDGYIALLYPWHGRREASFDGKYVYGPNGSKIGYWMSDVCDITCASEHDLAVIILYQGNWPGNLNRVYGQDASHYWTITTEPSTLGSCGNLSGGSEWGDVVQQQFNYDVATPNEAPRTGTIPGSPGSGFYSGPISKPDGQSLCTVWTDLYWHNPLNQPWPYRDSGAPWKLNADVTSVWAVSSGAAFINGWSNYKLWVTPLYNGMQVFKDSPGHTMHLCHDAGCS